MKKMIIGVVIAGTLVSAAWAQSTLEPASMPSDSTTLMSSTNGSGTNDVGVETMRRGTNAPAWGRTGTPPGAWQRSTNAPAWKSTGRSGSTIRTTDSSVDTDARVNTKAGTSAEPIRGENTPSGTTPTPGGSSSTLPSTSAPNF